MTHVSRGVCAGPGRRGPRPSTPARAPGAVARPRAHAHGAHDSRHAQLEHLARTSGTQCSCPCWHCRGRAAAPTPEREPCVKVSSSHACGPWSRVDPSADEDLDLRVGLGKADEEPIVGGPIATRKAAANLVREGD